MGWGILLLSMWVVSTVLIYLLLDESKWARRLAAFMIAGDIAVTSTLTIADLFSEPEYEDEETHVMTISTSSSQKREIISSCWMGEVSVEQCASYLQDAGFTPNLDEIREVYAEEEEAYTFAQEFTSLHI